jgi:hypothetical protein
LAHLKTVGVGCVEAMVWRLGEAWLGSRLRGRFVPALLILVAGIAGSLVSPWWLLSIPFVAVGAEFSEPNLNLARGFPSYLSMGVGWLLMQFHQASGLAVFTGAAAGFYGSVLEMLTLAKVYDLLASAGMVPDASAELTRDTRDLPVPSEVETVAE